MYLDGVIKYSDYYENTDTIRSITINSEPSGAYIWDYYGKLMGQTPLTVEVDFKHGKNINYRSITLTKENYYDEKIKILTEYDIDDVRGAALFGRFLFDCLTIYSLPFDILIGFPIHLSIPNDADSFYVMGKVIYDGRIIKLVPSSIPKPMSSHRKSNNYYASSDNTVEIMQAVINGINTFNQQMQQNTPRYQPPSPAPRPTPAAPAQTSPQRTVTPTTPNFKRFCPRTYKSGVVHGEWDSRTSVGCPACRGTINW